MQMANNEKKLFAKSVATVYFLTLFVVACDMETRSTEKTSQPRSASISGPITPLPDHVVVDSAKAALGQRLFSDPRLSRNGKMSCATCHNLQNAGVDSLPTSLGVDGRPSARNTPTVFNAAFNFRLMWDGRAASLEEQVGLPVQNPQEMASSWQHVINVLQSDKYYSQRFSDIYDSSANEINVSDAIATFERTLVTPNAPFDRFLRGDKSALSPNAQEGWRLFRERGCIACHQGVNIGGNMFQKFGVMGNFFRDRHKDDPLDQGRYNITHLESDRHVFKVPSLRNVAKTAPYFHDGSVKTLPDAVRTMGYYQLGQDLSSDEIDKIVAFLESLTGCYQGRCL